MNANDAKYGPLEILVLAEATASFFLSHVQAAPGMSSGIQHKWLFAQTPYTYALVQTTLEMPPPIIFTVYFS